MHMQKSCHLVALDNRLAKDFFPLYSTTIDPKYDYTLYSVLITKIKMALSNIPLP